MKLKINQRRKIYKELMIEIENGSNFFFCHRLKDFIPAEIYWNEYRGEDQRILKEVFPEIWIFRPRTKEYAWFNDHVEGMQKRYDILAKAYLLAVK